MALFLDQTSLIGVTYESMPLSELILLSRGWGTLLGLSELGAWTPVTRLPSGMDGTSFSSW